MSPGRDGATRVHASCVAFPVDRGDRGDHGERGDRSAAGWAGVLLRGPSGVGKSSFALRLMALGARLVADDQTQLSRASAAVDGAFDVIASPAPRLSGFIEARGVGLLQVDPLEAASLRWVVELRPPGRAAGDRLPPLERATLLGVSLPLLRLEAGELAASALCCLAQGGALLDPDAALAEVKAGERRAERHKGGDERSGS